MKRTTQCMLLPFVITATTLHGAVYDISTAITTFDPANDSLSNTGGVSNWTAGWADNTDFSNVDFTSLGLSEITVTTAAGTSAAVANYSGANFNGLTITTSTGNNFFYNDNFSGASFVGSTLNLTSVGASGNQPFVFADLSNADFSGATINWNPFSDPDADRINLFRDANLSGSIFTGATFNIQLDSTAGSYLGFFRSSESGSIDLSGVIFNFTGDTTIVSELTSTMLEDLGTNAVIDQAFIDNNYATFGYSDVSEFSAELESNGISVPEPSGMILLILGSITLFTRRSR